MASNNFAQEKKVIDALLKSGRMTRNQLDLAGQQHRALLADGQQGSLLDVLVRSRFCSRENVADILGKGSSYAVTPRALLPRHICVRYQLIPVRVDRRILTIRAAMPLTASQQAIILAACVEPAEKLQISATDRISVTRAIESSFQESVQLSDSLDKLRREEATGLLVQSAVNALLSEALDVNASDIHIDYLGDTDSWISWRVDGEIHRKHLMPRKVIGPIVMRIKTLCGMDASESRRDQDGRMSHAYRGRLIDFRVNSLPISGGEALALRALDAEKIPGLESMFPAQPKMIETLVGLTKFKDKRGGLVIISGNTGSGKSTTLYALTQRMPRDRINFISVENPVEFTLPLSRQYQVNPMLNQTMAEIERALLRQDLDAAMIGEIRGQDSAHAAFNVAESGHLCLSTTHAKSSLQTLHRLMSFFPSAEDRERSAFILSQFVQMILSQKLVRSICPDCRIKCGDYWTRDPNGCPTCNQTGYKGRVLVHDSLIFETDDDGRSQLYRILLSGEYEGIGKIPGVTRLTRGNVALDLCREGYLDHDDALEMEGL